MDRLLKPVFYRLVIGTIEFSQVVHVYSTPRQKSIITLQGYNFLVTQDAQNLTMYFNQDYKKAKSPESISAILMGEYSLSEIEEIQKKIRAIKNAKWDEIEVLVSGIEKNALVKTELSFWAFIVIPLLFLGSIYAFYKTGVWPWFMATALSMLWTISIRRELKLLLKGRH